MTTDNRLLCDRFPRASGYNPEWVLAGVSGGANDLYLAKWLAEALELRAGMRVLDLGCGRAISSAYVRAVGRRRAEVELFDPIISMPALYTKKPMLRPGKE